jgi:hypothetical protein
VPELVPTLLVTALVLLALVGMLLSWRGRRRRSAVLGTVPSLPADPGEPIFTTEALYVATTLEAQELQRVAVTGLAVRGRATLQVFASGISLAIPGQDAVFLPVELILGVGTGTVTIDRVVEPGGMVVITWTLGSTPVDTYLRPLSADDKTRIIDAIGAIRPSSVAANPSNDESEL